MSLRTAFIWYVLIAAVLATTACMIIVKCLDEPRIALYFKYQEQAQLIPVPEGGSFQNYVSTEEEDLDGAVTKISADLARYLGRLHNVSGIETIVYDGDTYEWNGKATTKSSKWEADGETLVKAITDDWKAEHNNAWATGVTYKVSFTADDVTMTYTVVVPSAE